MILKSLISNPRRRQFFNLLLFYSAYLWFRSFSNSVLGPYFLEQNVTIPQMVLGSLWFFLAGGLLLLLVKKYSSRTAWLLAIILTFLAVLAAVGSANIWLFYLFNILLGLNLVLFFVPYNIAHFRLTPNHRTSYSAAILFSVYPVIAFITPLLAGWLAQKSYSYIWSLSGIFFLIALWLVKFQSQFKFKLNLRQGLAYIKPTLIFAVLEGLWETVIFGAIPIFTLYFIQTPLYFGTYLSYLALMSILANLFLGQLSDKLRQRLKFLIPVTGLLGLTTMFLPLAVYRLPLWLILTGALQFLTPLFWNFSTAFFVDLQPDVVRAMPVREWVLAISRSVGFAIAFLNFYLEARPTYIFYLFGGIMFVYVWFLFHSRRRIKSMLSLGNEN